MMFSFTVNKWAFLHFLFCFLVGVMVRVSLFWSEYHRCCKDERVLYRIQFLISGQVQPTSFSAVKRSSSGEAHWAQVNSPWLAQSGEGVAAPMSEADAPLVIGACAMSSKTTCATVNVTTRACSCVNNETEFKNRPELPGTSEPEPLCHPWFTPDGALKCSVSAVDCMSQCSCLISPQPAEALGI